jgi:maltose alpha-D-glucosyltransferase/alpha-amylase
MRTLAHRTARGVERLAQATARDMDAAPRLLPEDAILRRFDTLLHMEPLSVRIRTHGDLQLDNVLYMGKDFMLVDFDGDVRLPLGERIIKRPPIRDAACMIVSIGITAEKALRRCLERTPTAAKELGPWLFLWRRSACLAFYEAYLEAMQGTSLALQPDAVVRQFLQVFLLEQLLRNLGRSLEEEPGDVPLLLDMADFLLKLFP